MAKRIPTKPGDVLILATSKSYSAFAVGRVFRDGQHDFGNQAGITYVTDRAAALAAAKALLLPGRGSSFRTSTPKNGLRFQLTR